MSEMLKESECIFRGEGVGVAAAAVAVAVAAARGPARCN